MTSNKRVFLFTRRFPYFKTEAFLEAEIEILAKAFSEVIIVPTEISDEIRKVPENVKIDTSFAKKFQNKKQRFLFTICNFFFIKTLWKYKSKLTTINGFKRILQFSSNVIVYQGYFKNYPFTKNDLLYTYWFAEATKAFADLKKEKDFKLISRAHRYDLYEGLPTTPSFWPYRKDVLEKIDCLYSISEHGKEYLESKYYVMDKIKVAKLGVFDRGMLSPDNIGNKINFVSVSRIDPMKRVQLIANCIQEFAKNNSKYSINWVHFGDGAERNNIINSIENISNLSIELNGAVPNSYIYKYYEENPVTIFINLSSSEGIPVSIMEAQSFGIPIIATNVGGSGEIVKKEVGVLLDENPTIKDVELAINHILSSDIKRLDVKNFWSKNFNAETNYKNYVNDLK